MPFEGFELKFDVGAATSAFRIKKVYRCRSDAVAGRNFQNSRRLNNENIYKTSALRKTSDTLYDQNVLRSNTPAKCGEGNDFRKLPTERKLFTFQVNGTKPHKRT